VKDGHANHREMEADMLEAIPERQPATRSGTPRVFPTVTPDAIREAFETGTYP